MEQSQSYNEALGYAQEYAVRNEQNIIDVSSIALGILNTDSPFSGIFSQQEKEKLTEQLTKKTLEIGTNPLETDAVPLTMNAGLLIKFARQYAMEVGDGVLDVYHVMLALLSYLNETATIFSRSGWIFENYLAQVNKIVSPEINIDRLELDLVPSVKEPYSKLRKKFWAEDYKNNIADNLTAEANRHATFGKYATCRQLCEVVLDITKEGIDPNRLIIYCLCMEKEYDRALALYKEWGIDDDVIRMNIGVCYRETGQHEQAIELFRSFGEMTAELHNAIGFSLNGLGRYDEAISEFNAAIAANPEYVFAYNNKGYALLKTGHTQEAKELILQAHAMDMGSAFIYRNLALVNIEEKNKSEALANIDKALFYRYRERFGDDIDEVAQLANTL